MEDIKKEQVKPYTMLRVTKMVSGFSHIPVEVLKSKAQYKSVTCARNVCYHFIRQLVKSKSRTGKVPYKKIGKFFNRDHSTLLNGKQTLKDMLFTQEEMYVNLMTAMENKIANQEVKL